MKTMLTTLHDVMLNRKKRNEPVNQTYYISRNAAVDLYDEVAQDQKELEGVDDDTKCNRINGGSIFGIPLVVEGEE